MGRYAGEDFTDDYYRDRDQRNHIQQLQFELAELKKGARLGQATTGMLLAELTLRIEEGHMGLDYKPVDNQS